MLRFLPFFRQRHLLGLPEENLGPSVLYDDGLHLGETGEIKLEGLMTLAPGQTLRRIRLFNNSPVLSRQSPTSPFQIESGSQLGDAFRFDAEWKCWLHKYVPKNKDLDWQVLPELIGTAESEGFALKEDGAIRIGKMNFDRTCEVTDCRFGKSLVNYKDGLLRIDSPQGLTEYKFDDNLSAWVELNGMEW